MNLDATQLQTLVQQLQAMQAQMTSMASQHQADQNSIRSEVLQLQAENAELRHKWLPQLTPLPPPIPLPMVT